MKKLLDKLNPAVKTFGALALMAGSIVGIHQIIHRNYNPYNMKTMPKVQPWVWLYDKNHDGEADSAMIGLKGLGGISALYKREPTEDEIEWYSTH